MYILFPGDYFAPRQPDATFAEAYRAFKALGCGCGLLPADGGLTLAGPVAQALAGETVLYRGWMLDAAAYRALCAAIAASGGRPFTSPEAYARAHYLPGWYASLRDLTPETAFFDAATVTPADLRALGWPRFFLKDHVKSLKTARGAVLENPDELPERLAEMMRVRGRIEGGLCVRRVEDFRPETERRYFILDGRAHAADGGAIPPPVAEAARRLAGRFLSVDLIQTIQGTERIVEVGDGQVSDLVGWTAEAFAALWRAYV